MRPELRPSVSWHRTIGIRNTLDFRVHATLVRGRGYNTTTCLPTSHPLQRASRVRAWRGGSVGEKPTRAPAGHSRGLCSCVDHDSATTVIVVANNEMVRIMMVMNRRYISAPPLPLLLMFLVF